MTKGSAKSRSGKQLSAEEMSVRTRRAIGHFPNNYRETSARDDVIMTQPMLDDWRSIASDQEPVNPDAGVAPRVRVTAPDRSRAAPQGRGSARSSRRNLVDKTASKALGAQEAVEKIGGILAGLSAADRFAVLKKINGAFGYKTKGQVPDQPTQTKTKKAPAVVDKPAPKREPKLSHNEIFSAHPWGKMLALTSKVIKSSSRSSTEKVSNEVHYVHKEMLRQKSAFTESFASNPNSRPPAVPDIESGEEALGLLIRAMKHITTNSTIELNDTSASSIVEGAWCLCCGSTDHALLSGDWVSAPRPSWPSATCTVQRTDEEAERAAVRLMEAKQAAKAKGKEKRKRAVETANTERPPEKVPKGSISSSRGSSAPSSEASLTEGSEEAHEGMDLDGQEQD